MAELCNSAFVLPKPLPPLVEMCIRDRTMNGTMLEATLHLASGFNSVSFVLTNANGREETRVLEGIEECAKRRPYWDRLVKANADCVKGGLCEMCIRDSLYMSLHKQLRLSEL